MPSGPQVFVCIDDPGPMVDPNPGCRRAELHTPQPGPNAGYVATAGWADQMLETHDQLQCPGCGRWLIWEPREATTGA